MLYDKLKKNEIKITVIATGFPENQPSQNRPVQNTATATIAPTESSFAGILKRNQEKGKIFNGPLEPRKESTVTEKVEVKKEVPKEDEDDDWGAIPAFLRRSRLK